MIPCTDLIFDQLQNRRDYNVRPFDVHAGLVILK